MDATQEDALKIMAKEKYVPESEWQENDIQGRYIMQCGLVDKNGARIGGLVVDLIVGVVRKPSQNKFVFTLNNRTKKGLERVYQIEARNPIDHRNRHSQPHQHVGSIREDLPNIETDYDAVLKKFMVEAGVSFEIEPTNPAAIEKFTLK